MIESRRETRPKAAAKISPSLSFLHLMITELKIDGLCQQLGLSSLIVQVHSHKLMKWEKKWDNTPSEISSILI